MPRSAWKQPYVVADIARRVDELLHKLRTVKGFKQDVPVRVMQRASTIEPHYVGVQFEVHNGRGYVPLVVSEKMVGHRFGEFAWTRKMPQHPLTKRQALPTKAK